MINKQQQKQCSYIPRIHLHVMSIEEENCWRYESNVKILDINLNFIEINIYKCYTCKFGHLTRWFRKLCRQKQIEFTSFKISRTIKTQKERERRESGIQRHQVGGRGIWSAAKAEHEKSRTLSMVSLMIASTSCLWLSDGNYSFSRISPLQDFGARLMYLLYCQIFPGQRLLIQKIYILSSFIM